MAELPQVQSSTVRSIWAAVEAAQDRSERHYLGASVLGDDCERRLWDDFRWVRDPEWFDGQKLSIFETGHRWEPRLIELLRAAGIDVDDVDPATGEQFLVRFAGGHAGGHLDGEAEKVPEAPTTRHVLECKTHKDKSFKDLVRQGVQKSKPAHYAQMQAYMDGRGLKRALYVAVNKNDDEIYTERVNYDPAFAVTLIAKAERIVTSSRRPQCGCPVYFLRSGYGCARHDTSAFARRNCRTCLHATAALDGDARWMCDRSKRDLPLAEQKAGCPHHLYIPDLVPGDQVDVDEAAETVTYVLRSGRRWVDGAHDESPARASVTPLISNEFGLAAGELEGAFA